MTFGEDLLAIDGTSPQTAATALAAAGVDAVGVNCGVGPLICLDALSQMGRPSAGLARSIVPNAGLPQRVEGQFVYAAEPAYFADAVPRFLDAGARIIGGCCGTTPEHIRHMRQALDVDRRAAAGHCQPTGGPRAHDRGRRTPRSPIADRHSAARRPSRRRRPASPTCSPRSSFVVSVEIDPPRSVRIERTIEAARLLQDAGVDLVNISDSAMARVRMGAMAVAFGIQHDLDLECLVHFTTRDRNLMALESELLGAHALGVRNILALTGDPPRDRRLPDRHRHLGRRLDRPDRHPQPAQPGRGPGRQADRRAGRLHRSPARSIRPRPTLEQEIERLAAKLEAGADLIMTQPIYAREQWDRFMERAVSALADRAAAGRCCSASCRCTPTATPSSCTTRCPASRSPTRSARRWPLPASAAPRSGWRWPTRCSSSWRR